MSYLNEVVSLVKPKSVLFIQLEEVLIPGADRIYEELFAVLRVNRPDVPRNLCELRDLLRRSSARINELPENPLDQLQRIKCIADQCVGLCSDSLRCDLDNVWTQVREIRLQTGAEDFLSTVLERQFGSDSSRIGIVSRAPISMANLIVNRLGLKDYIGNVFGCEYVYQDGVELSVLDQPYWDRLSRKVSDGRLLHAIASSDPMHLQYAMTSGWVSIVLDFNPNRVKPQPLYRTNVAPCFAIRPNELNGELMDWSSLSRVCFGH